MVLNFIFWLFYGASVASATTAQYGMTPSQFKEGYYSLGLEATYLSTSANYTSQGTSLDLLDQYGYSAFQSLLYGRYDFSNAMSFYSELPLRYAQSENPTDTYSAFKFPGILFGVNYNFDLSSFKIIPQIAGYYAIEKFDRDSDQVLSSDGTSSIDLGSHFFIPFSNLTFHGFLSYQYRLEGFSGLLHYQTDLTYKSESFSVTGGVRGFESVTKDENTDTPGYRHSYLMIVNGGSWMYGAVDPSRLDVFAITKYAATSSLDIYGGIAKSLRGKNSADMMTITLGLELFFGGSPKQPQYQYSNDDSFRAADEDIDPKIEEEIRTYNKPKPKKKPKRREKPKTKQKPKNDLEISRKELGKKSTSTSPIKTKPKSKKPSRVNIDF